MKDEIEQLLNENSDGFTYRVYESGSDELTLVGRVKEHGWDAWACKMILGTERDAEIVLAQHRFTMDMYSWDKEDREHEREHEHE